MLKMLGILYQYWMTKHYRKKTTNFWCVKINMENFPLKNKRPSPLPVENIVVQQFQESDICTNQFFPGWAHSIFGEILRSSWIFVGINNNKSLFSIQLDSFDSKSVFSFYAASISEHNNFLLVLSFLLCLV